MGGARAVVQRGLANDTDGGRALYASAKAFVEAGMPAGLRDVDEQAAFFAITSTRDMRRA